MSTQPRACVNGDFTSREEACIPVTDQGFTRGHGAVETIGVWDGRPFRLSDHLDRLGASLEAIDLPRPDLDVLQQEVSQVLAGVRDDAVLRIYITASGTRVVIVDDVPTRPATRRLVPVVAPWIQPPSASRAAGAKTMATLSNVLASRTAQAAGGDEALLLTTDGIILEGPTFAVCWASGERIQTPSSDLGLVDSVSQRLVVEIAREMGYRVEHGAYTLVDLARADEVLITSTSRDVLAIGSVGELTFSDRTPIRDRINERLWQVRRGS